MLDQIDLDQRIGKRDYEQRLPELEARFYAMEQAIVDASVPTLILVEGWAGTSKIGTISTLTQRLDPRGIRVFPITPPRTSEKQYPWLYRFWLKLPEYGQIAIFDRSWYRQLLATYTHRQLSAIDWRRRCEEIVAFERQLADDGALIVKLWLHISKPEQRRRFRTLRSDPVTAWQVTAEDRWQQRHYGRVCSAAEDLIARTHTPTAPWAVIAATNKRHAHLAAFEAILGIAEARLGAAAMSQASGPDTLGIGDTDVDANSSVFRRARAAAIVDGRAHPARLENTATPPAMTATADLATEADDATLLPPLPNPPVSAPRILQGADLTQQLAVQPYERKLRRLQAKLHLLGFQVYQQKRPVVLVFEGWDAAGKGGAIQRITEQIDPRGYIVHAIAAPSGDDRLRHYLYRFWRRLPPAGAIAIFDRSWYGRVLVERVEGFARPDEWQRAYTEINEFEHQLVAFGAIVCKFWLHISSDEQLRRFEERSHEPRKAWKLTDEDWRNRAQRPQYQEAADEMLLRTSTPAAPWTIVAAEDKRFGRIEVLKTVVRRLENEFGTIKLKR